MNEPDHTIINCFGAEYRGIVQYYLLAGDVYRLDRLHWVMQTSLLKTLAGKYGSTVTTMARRYKVTIETPHGPRMCLQVIVERGKGRKPLVATFGGIPLIRQKHAALKDRAPVPAAAPRKELIDRLRAGRCEICGDADQVQVHQIRKLSDLDKPGQPHQPEWARIMAQAATQDPRGLRHLPRHDPPREANRVNHGIVAGEPGELKGSRRVCARHDQQLGGASPLWRLMAPTTSRWQLLSREAGWGGSRSAKSRP